MNNPWICPRCDVVNAPWVARCDCKETPEQRTAQLHGIMQEFHFPSIRKECGTGNHDWHITGYCLKCKRHKRDVPCVGGF